VLEVDGERVDARDGAALPGGQTVTIKALEDAEIVLVDAA
jgi:quercetin 2,3-dioxygenase